MCGIGGYYGFRDDNLVKKMSRLMEHRGPDGEGIYTDSTTTLLNRRLAIIDREGGNQPIWNEDKSLVVVYNGEIYNYRELREELESAGHTFSTKTDTEIIVHGYEQWGEACFDRFNGMFGIALYDVVKKRLVLARDHFGIKPLYYAFGRGNASCLLFASEIKPLIYSGKIDRKPNDRTLYRYLVFRVHDDTEETFFEGVRRLPPGHMMLVEDGMITVKKYTTIKDRLSSLKPKEALTSTDKELFKEKLFTAIRRRLVAEVPMGSALSGGLDSSTVVAVVNKLLQEHHADASSLGKRQKTYSAVFPGSLNDEEAYVDALIRKMADLDFVKVRPTPEEFFQDIEEFVRAQEEPTISTGPYAQYQVMRRAKKDVTVLLDGQGADEMMAGYLPYYFVNLRQLMRQKRVRALVAESWAARDILWKLAVRKLTASLGLRTDVDPKSMLSAQFREVHAGERFVTNSSNLRARLIEDIFCNSLPSLLRYEDKNAMRFSIEGRVPFLDVELLEYLFTLPESAIIKGGWNKAILREAMKDILPEKIVWRRNKIGFTTPEHEWFLRMKNRIYSIFLSERFAKRKYFDQPAVVRAFEEFVKGRNDDTMLFWRLLNVELWLRVFFDDTHVVEKPAERGMFEPNAGKKLEIEANGATYIRFPVKTSLFAKGDDYAAKLAEECRLFLDGVSKQKKLPSPAKQRWIAVVSEKIVAIAQGRSYFIWDIAPGFWAKWLSKFVKRTPYGIGLGSPWTMQLAIQEVGLPRIILASVVSAVSKPFGISGMFYRIAGRTVASIDGPTEYSLYPSNVSAKLGPKDPETAAKQISEAIRERLTAAERRQFGGAAVIDANDLGRDVLGNATELPNETIAMIMRDNPMGQSSEQTPLVIAFAHGG